jgi:hypothetical protein
VNRTDRRSPFYLCRYLGAKPKLNGPIDINGLSCLPSREHFCDRARVRASFPWAYMQVSRVRFAFYAGPHHRRRYGLLRRVYSVASASARQRWRGRWTSLLGH